MMHSKYLYTTALVMTCIAMGCSDDSTPGLTHSCQEGQIWDEASQQCQEAAAACQADIDCSNGLVCSGGVCQSRQTTSECTNDGDCGADKKCEAGRCTAKNDSDKQCQTDGDCDNGQCVEGKCSPNSQKCANDGDCEDGQCIDGTCRPNSQKCENDGDCEDGQCIEGSCRPNSQKCANDGDCEDGQCIGGSCRPDSQKCENDGDCEDGQCIEGSCRPDSQKCANDGDCEDGQCIEGQCHANEQKCEKDRDCDANWVCRDEICVPRCTKDEDCESPEICRNEQCILECSLDDDCDGDFVCRDNRCTVECGDDADCDGGRVCKENVCAFECEKDGDCDGDLVCKNNRCKAECQAKEDCREGFACADQKCVPVCKSDSDCAESFICTDSLCVKDPLWCVSDLDCSDKLYCHKNHCIDSSIECYSDDECSGELVCKTNKCVPECKSDSDCTGGMVCKNQRCKVECASNADCTGSRYCKDSRCTSACSTDDDKCPAQYMCIDGQCAHECEKSSDCSGNLMCSAYRCVECAADSDCGVDMVCQLNTCEKSKDIRYPCLIEDDGFKMYKTDADYNAALNVDGSINLCKLGYHPSENEISADPAKDTCIALYEARSYDFYGDGIDSNCDGYDYNLMHAIFVAPESQGEQKGDDSHSGNYNPSTKNIEAKATIQGAFGHLNNLYDTSKGAVSVFPDILVMANISKTLKESLQIPPKVADSLDKLPELQAISTKSDRTAYSEHTILVKQILSDPNKKIADYGFYTEGNYPKEKVRIFGGFTRNPLDNADYLHWQRMKETDVTKLEYVIPEITQDNYVLVVSSSTSSPVNVAMNYFDMSIRSTAKSLPRGTTFVGFSCGRGGCEGLNLDHTTWTVTAPDGISPTGTLAVGADGNNGKDGHREEGDTSLYNESTWCTESQICSGDKATGTGGCGGHLRKKDKLADGDKSGNYDGSGGGYKGKAGSAGQDILSLALEIMAKGGSGGNGLVNAGISYDTCGTDSSVDDSLVKDEMHGKNGANGQNGTHANLVQTLKPSQDHTCMYFSSNYDDLGDLNGVDGAQGGGGGGGAVYQIHSATTYDPSWISAGSGGNGGCGGKGGQAGGTGGSAIGLILTSAESGDAAISLENTVFHVAAGNGGKAQSGSDGGEGGKGGKSKGYAKKNSINIEIYCDKATAGGNGGNGGGGGAGAGGIAGQAILYLMTCSRNVTSDCDEATESKPCFNADNRSTLKNCGYRMPNRFVVSFDDSVFGTVISGKTMADSKDNVAGQGSVAGTAQTDGQYSFLTTWIGEL